MAITPPTVFASASNARTLETLACMVSIRLFRSTTWPVTSVDFSTSWVVSPNTASALITVS